MEKVNFGNFDIFDIFKSENIPDNSSFDITTTWTHYSKTRNEIRKDKIEKIWKEKYQI
jgi:hypothetical protein